MPAIVWAVLGALSIVYLGDLRDSALPAVGVLLVWGAGVLALPRPKLPIRAIFIVALLVRVVLLASPPTLSDDLFRYVWEGTLTAHGGNPYLTAPAEPVLPALVHDAHRAMVNHPHIPSIYPPLAMGLFTALAAVWADPLPFKLVSGLADAGTAFVLARILTDRGHSTAGAWLYALLPLGAIESAGSGHLDPIAVLCLVLAIDAWDRRRTGVIWAGLGALLKLLPGVLFVALLRRPKRTWPEALVVLLLGLGATWPFLDAGPRLLEGFGTYAQHWSFNGSIYPLTELVLGAYARPLLVGVGALIVLYALRKRTDPAEVALFAGGAFVLLSPTVHPWYIAWAWVPALIVGVRAFTLLAALMPLAYVVLATIDPATGQWHESPLTRLAIYGPFFALLAYDALKRIGQPGPYPAPSA